MNFTLIIPAFKEYENLKIILPRVHGITDDIIVIDSCTNDGTKELCEEHGMLYIGQQSKGKGNALIEAVEYASYDVICFFDADLAHNPNEIMRLVTPILNEDVLHVSGSRMLGGSSELFADTDHAFRLFGSLLINYLISIKFGVKMTDCQNGFRAIHKSLFKKLEIKSSHTTIEQELVGKTLASGHIVLEIPTHEYSRISGSSKINLLKHSSSYIISLLTILFSRKINIDKILLEKLKKKYSYNWWEQTS